MLQTVGFTLLEPGDSPVHFKAELNTQMVEMMGSWVDAINVWSPVMEEDEEQNVVESEK